jgi:ubiquinone/menaquinone biosynthesis C-methylase UbiE
MPPWSQKRKVMHAYNVTADIYDERYSQEQHAKYAKALKSADVGGKTVLDVGCGSGLFFAEAADKAQLVVGVDVSRGLLVKANEHAKKFGNVFVVQADADHLPFRAGSFDGVFAFTVLQNMPKPIVTLMELRRTAKSGGRVVVTGLKKAFGLDKFMDFVEGSGMRLEAFVDEDAINCFIATLSA